MDPMIATGRPGAESVAVAITRRGFPDGAMMVGG
jgi:hypothetical protein